MANITNDIGIRVGAIGVMDTRIAIVSMLTSTYAVHDLHNPSSIERIERHLDRLKRLKND